MKRVLNFSAGPSALPFEVLKEAQINLLDYKGYGLSIMESSHRVKMFEDVYDEAIALMRENYKIPDNFKILFLQGGASSQFALVPMNLKQSGKVEYVDTGVWSSKAIKEAKIQNLDVKVIASSQDTNYDRIPQNINFSDDIDYGYITSNNTIYGTQYKEFPKCKNLVIDASSDIFSYHVDWDKIALMFAGAQKNAGPAGVTIVIIREDLLDRAGEIPSMFKYLNHANSNSMFNTPPTFSIYLLALTMKWIKNQGGIKQIEQNNIQKAKEIYKVIDERKGFYVGHSQKDSRSHMNVSFTIGGGNEELEKQFVAQAAKADMIGLKGHRLLGGIRASIYNAVSLENVHKLKTFMEDFAYKNC
ncbi:MAG: 3-phosphoserine/phosphohydroxythreonine aminotransferase [Proteobacteria bacterium]|nr:MAG: 3-phosphoserine/phosphohydroxythreonine aminotransferase [Pseudomonadota bacterium]